MLSVILLISKEIESGGDNDGDIKRNLIKKGNGSVGSKEWSE